MRWLADVAYRLHVALWSHADRRDWYAFGGPGWTGRLYD